MRSAGEAADSHKIAERWCRNKGPGWSVIGELGSGGTARVFEIQCPEGHRALKIYDASFSSGQRGEIENKRIEQQLSLCGHNCPSLVNVYEGGEFEGRLYLVMGRAPGQELEERLGDVTPDKIRHIVDQTARAALFLKKHNLCHRDIKAANIFVSDDFKQVTLLDVSVIRNIYDPVGSGTDHDGQLPVLATARYSPPEYLFRLLDAGPELWHALTIYQLGALLCDLIMREPLFQAEYLRSSENRYRFAWLVATETPKLYSDHVDQDLLFLARRALDKDWQRRSTLQIEDFLSDVEIEKSRSLQALGLGTPAILNEKRSATDVRERVREVATLLEGMLSDRLRELGATATHKRRTGRGGDASWVVTFTWVAPADVSPFAGEITLTVTLGLGVMLNKARFSSSVDLLATVEREQRQARLDLPDVDDVSGAEDILTTQIVSALATLAVRLSRSPS